MDWYKTASTYEGEAIRRAVSDLTADIRRLKSDAASGGPSNVLPRWRGELRRSILLLPPTKVLGNMSMYELRELRSKVNDIESEIRRYDRARAEEIGYAG